jgi:hypothetical protein
MNESSHDMLVLGDQYDLNLQRRARIPQITGKEKLSYLCKYA